MFNESTAVTRSSRAQTLTSACQFNQRLIDVTLPSRLQELTSAVGFNLSWEVVTLPCREQTLISADMYCQCLVIVTMLSLVQP